MQVDSRSSPKKIYYSTPAKFSHAYTPEKKNKKIARNKSTLFRLRRVTAVTLNREASFFSPPAVSVTCPYLCYSFLSSFFRSSVHRIVTFFLSLQERHNRTWEVAHTSRSPKKTNVLNSEHHLHKEPGENRNHHCGEIVMWCSFHSLSRPSTYQDHSIIRAFFLWMKWMLFLEEAGKKKEKKKRKKANLSFLLI